MPQVNAAPGSALFRELKDTQRRLHALEVTVPIKQDSNYQTGTFDTAWTSYVGDGVTEVGPLKCFGNTRDGTNVEISGSCQIGLDGAWSWVSALGGFVPVWASIPGPIGGVIGVQVDGGSTYEPGSGPGIYFLSVAQASLGGVQITVAASRVIQVLDPASTQGLSEHSFAMMFASTMGQTIHFEERILTINPQ